MGATEGKSETEIKIEKQQRKMSKILFKAWNLENSNAFQESTNDNMSLSSIGKRLDEGGYSHGKNGWISFAQDLGSVYNYHITNKTETTQTAHEHLQSVVGFLSKIDIEYGKATSVSQPAQDQSSKAKIKKRKLNGDRTEGETDEKSKEEAISTLNFHVPKKSKSKKNDMRQSEVKKKSEQKEQQKLQNHKKSNDSSLTLTQREELAMIALQDYIESCGGARDSVADYRIRMKPKSFNSAKNKYETDYFSPQGRFFRSKKDIAKYLKLDLNGFNQSNPSNASTQTTSKTTSKKAVVKKKIENKNKIPKNKREFESERRKLRKELDKLFRQHRKANKTLEDFREKKLNSNTPVNADELVDDDEFIESHKIDEDVNTSTSLPHMKYLQKPNEILNVPSLPNHCIPDVIMIWDFLCTFHRVLSLDPIGLDEFIAVLRYNQSDAENNDSNYFPIYLAEAHLSIISLLIKDRSSDSWWWCTLDTASTVLGEEATKDAAEKNKTIESDEDEDDESEDSQKEETAKTKQDSEDLSQSVTSAVPPKPLPSYVDLLLPPAKPPLDLLTPHTWPALTGAVCCRILHKFKRLRNEVDDETRENNNLKPISIGERKNRELISSQRVLSECMQAENEDDSCDEHVNSSIDHLTSGRSYLQLSFLQRVRILRVLIEACYDTTYVHSCIEDNYKSRVNAEKALDVEERKYKRQLKEEASKLETKARNRLAADAKEAFFQKKRKELRETNSQEFVESLTNREIIRDFLEDDEREAYDALPSQEAFTKSDVNSMVTQIQNETLFNADKVTIMTLKELQDLEEKELFDLENAFQNTNEPSLEVEIKDKKQRIHSLTETRLEAIEELKDAISTGTMKHLKSAIKSANSAHLTGEEEILEEEDDERRRIWALDILRNAMSQLQILERRKDLVSAQTDLISKRDKCFFRMEPIGEDRFRNRYWYFPVEDESNNLKLFMETDRFFHLVPSMMENEEWLRESGIGVSDQENDLYNDNSESNTIASKDVFLSFSRKEYHSSGLISCLPKRCWSHFTSDATLHSLVKMLNEKGLRESNLKSQLKQLLEKSQQGNVEVNANSSSFVPEDDEKNVSILTSEQEQQTDLNELILSYRNSMGKFCGRNSDAPYSSSPQFFSKILIKVEADYYHFIKKLHLHPDHEWFGTRNAWIMSMKEDGNSFSVVRDGLLTLENAFYELTTSDTALEQEEEERELASSGRELLDDNVRRYDIELESITGIVTKIWNSVEARNVFLEIMKTSTTCSILALGLDLICRNCDVYLKEANLYNRSSNNVPNPSTRTRSNKSYDYYNDHDTVGVSTRRRQNTWQKYHDF